LENTLTRKDLVLKLPKGRTRKPFISISCWKLHPKILKNFFCENSFGTQSFVNFSKISVKTLSNKEEWPCLLQWSS